MKKLVYSLSLTQHNTERIKMAETTLEFALSSLTQQLVDNMGVIGVIKDEVSCLLSELHHLRAFLIDSNRNRRGSKILKHFVEELNRAINKAENSIDKFMIEVTLHKKRGIYRIFDLCYLVKAKRCCSDIRSIMEKLKEIRRDTAYALSLSLQLDDSKQTAHQLKRVRISFFFFFFSRILSETISLFVRLFMYFRDDQLQDIRKFYHK